jgi:hypothetical protein
MCFRENSRVVKLDLISLSANKYRPLKHILITGANARKWSNYDSHARGQKFESSSGTFHFTTEPLTTPAPSTVRVKPGIPATAVKGTRLLREGVTDRLLALEVEPFGFKTVMGNVPTIEMSVAGIDAESEALLIKVVERLLPLKRTTEPMTKPAPFTTTVNPLPPALTVEGERLLIVGFPDWVDVIGIGPSDKRQIAAPNRREARTILVRLCISNPPMERRALRRAILGGPIPGGRQSQGHCRTSLFSDRRGCSRT